MEIQDKKSCGNKQHRVYIRAYDFEMVEQVGSINGFTITGDIKEIYKKVDAIHAELRICQQACCREAAAATGLKEVEVIGNV